MPVSSSLVNRLIEGQVKVFPVAICYSNFPPEYEKKDVYAFAMKYGIIEECTVMGGQQENSLLAGEGEEVAEASVSYRVQYTERYNILLILQNRSKLMIDDRLIYAEPLFLRVCNKQTNGDFAPFDEELASKPHSLNRRLRSQSHPRPIHRYCCERLSCSAQPYTAVGCAAQ